MQQEADPATLGKMAGQHTSSGFDRPLLD